MTSDCRGLMCHRPDCSTCYPEQPDLFGHNQSPLLIGLWSPSMGSGKTEVAMHLERHSGFQRLAMAGALKRMFRTFLKASGFTDEEAEACVTDAVRKEQPLDILGGKTPRYAMQTLGTEWGRDLLDEDVWCRSGMGRAQRHMGMGKSVVFDDIRFPNEARAIEAAGGFMVKVFRSGATITNSHPSEGALADWDFAATIINDSSLEVLGLSTNRTVNHLRSINL